MKKAKIQYLALFPLLILHLYLAYYLFPHTLFTKFLQVLFVTSLLIKNKKWSEIVVLIITAIHIIMMGLDYLDNLSSWTLIHNFNFEVLKKIDLSIPEDWIFILVILYWLLMAKIKSNTIRNDTI